MERTRRSSGRAVNAPPLRVPIGDLERIRDLNRKCAGWVDEWDFIRDAVRRRLDECGQKYPNAKLA
jgi:hypothetical protein